VQKAVWAIIEERQRRPTMSEIAASLDTTPLRLRRRIHSQRELFAGTSCYFDGSPFRAVIGWCCLTYAADQMARGCKVLAAMRLAGFTNKSSFNRQLRQYFGCLPSQTVGRHFAIEHPGRDETDRPARP
jgi:AraC-like DNA-binding protein